VGGRAPSPGRLGHDDRMLYDDGRIALDDRGLLIRWYYLWGTKRIPYSSIRRVDRLQLGGWRSWRIWGSGDFRHWFNLDPKRPNKQVALEIHTGSRTVPTITPDDTDAVEQILTAKLA